MHRPIRFPVPRAALVLVTVIAGCTITPLREVSGPATDVSEQPDTLAFDDAAQQPTQGLLVDVEAAAWTIISSTAEVAVHSAPGDLYTRLGVLDSENDVIATGRRAAVGEDLWMEIHWANSTAWVRQSPFVRLNP